MRNTDILLSPHGLRFVVWFILLCCLIIWGKPILHALPPQDLPGRVATSAAIMTGAFGVACFLTKIILFVVPSEVWLFLRSRASQLYRWLQIETDMRFCHVQATNTRLMHFAAFESALVALVVYPVYLHITLTWHGVWYWQEPWIADTHPFTYLAGLLIGYGLIHAMPVVRRTKALLHAQPALARQYALFGFALDFVYCGGIAPAIVVLGKYYYSECYKVMRLVKLLAELQLRFEAA